MLRKSLMAVLLLAVTALAACGGPKPAQGLLTEDEIGKLESLDRKSTRLNSSH